VIEKARSELSEELAKIKSEIELEGRKVYDALKGDVGKLSMEAAQKILKRSI
jgi:F0F1-type ATP synthase membrane subunit b/b'